MMKRKTGVGSCLAVRGALGCALWMLVACGVADQEARHATVRFALNVRSTQFAPEADAWVDQSTPGANHGSSEALLIDAEPKQLATYLRFRTTGIRGEVKRATLRLYAFNGTSNGPKVYATSPEWEEHLLTGDNAPNHTGEPLADLGEVPHGGWVELDVTAQVTGDGVFSFALLPDSTNGADFYSREAESLTPELHVSWEEGEEGTCTTRLEEVTVGIDADAHVDSAAPERNHGAAPSLLVDSAPRRYETYLRFDTRGIRDPIRHAEVRLYAFNGSSNGPALHPASPEWEETEITWNNRPAYSPAPLGEIGAVEHGQWISFDVTEHLDRSAPPYAFALIPMGDNGVDLHSKESADSRLRPQLLLRVEKNDCDSVEAAYRYDQGSNGALAVDRSGSTLLLSWGGYGEFTLERRSSNDELVWSRRFPVEPSEAYGESPSGLVYAADFAPDDSVWTLLKFRFGDVDLGEGPLGHGDYLVRFGGDGEVLSYRALWSESGRAYPSDVEVDPSGHVVVTGAFTGRPDLGGGPIDGVSAQLHGNSGFVARYTSAGSLDWVRVFGNTANAAGLGVATGEDGTVLVCGTNTGTERGTFAGTPILGQTDAFGGEGVLARLSATGELQWAKGVGQSLQHCSLSRLGTAVATGTSSESLQWAGRVHAAAETFFVVAEVDGVERFALTGSGAVHGLEVDDDGGARVLLEGRDFTGELSPDPEQPFAVERINLDGNHRWTRRLGQFQEDPEFAIRPMFAVTAEGTSWVFGTFAGTQRFGPFDLTAQGSDTVLLRLSP